MRRLTVDWYRTRDEALDAEATAIFSEQPKYNVKHRNLVLLDGAAELLLHRECQAHLQWTERDRDLVRMAERVLAETGMAPAWLAEFQERALSPAQCKKIDRDFARQRPDPVLQRGEAHPPDSGQLARAFFSIEGATAPAT